MYPIVTTMSIGIKGMDMLKREENLGKSSISLYGNNVYYQRMTHISE